MTNTVRVEEWNGQRWVSVPTDDVISLIRKADLDKIQAIVDAVQAYLTAPADIQHTTDGDSAVPAEEAFYKLVDAFKAYRPDVKLPEKLT